MHLALFPCCFTEKHKYSHCAKNVSSPSEYQNEVYGGGDKAPLIFKFTLTPLPLYVLGKGPQRQLGMKMGWPHSWFRRLKEIKMFLARRESKRDSWDL
jgi:hypothetical protein